MPELPVLDSTIHYTETGEGTPIVFLHGNPTSSYIWRNVIPRAGQPGRLLAPDLIGMGASGKPTIDYRFVDHARYLDAWFDALDLDAVVLVGHDWGGALACDWAARHPDRVQGIALMEALVRPMSWSDFGEQTQQVHRAFRGDAGEAMVLDENAFIEQRLPRVIAGGLSPEDLDAYRAPYPTRESRLPMLQWQREMPLDGDPADVTERFEAFGDWLANSREVPKLLLTFDSGPGLMIGPEAVEWCLRNIAGLEVEACGHAGHHAPEDAPAAIGAAVAGWADRHDLRETESRVAA
jgi:haloalkane dehalogenase